MNWSNRQDHWELHVRLVIYPLANHKPIGIVNVGKQLSVASRPKCLDNSAEYNDFSSQSYSIESRT